MWMKKLARLITLRDERRTGKRPPNEGTFTHMSRVVFDPELLSTWVSYLEVDLQFEEVDTPWGPTRNTRSSDRVMVKEKRNGRYTEPVELSAGTADAKLDPRIDARGGKACVTWCGCDPDTREWRIFASYSGNGKEWSGPVLPAGGESPALHPSVAIDPGTGHAWIAYEDWGDGSIKLTQFDGEEVEEPVSISEGGRNFRPRVIVTDGKGKHRGAVAVAWDSYREGQYDIYLRLLHPERGTGTELRATRCPRWDSCVDMAEDLDGNIWLAWVRASNEVGDMSAMRNVHAKFFDGERFLYPSVPGHRFSPWKFQLAAWLLSNRYQDKEKTWLPRVSRGNEDRDGRLTWYRVNWFPKLQVDSRNRVYVFYRQGGLPLPPMLGFLRYRVYQGDRWSRPRRLRLGRGINILRLLRDFSVVIPGGRSIEGVWDQAYINIPKEVLRFAETKSKAIQDADGPRFRVRGEEYEETMHVGRTRLERKPAPTLDLEGESLTLLFGDTHNHSSVSVGLDPPDYHYQVARDYAALDFFALPENDYFFCGVPGIEAYISFLPKVFSAPDFICFQAHEFVSSAMGHRVMVFEGDDRRIMSLGAFNSQRDEYVNTTGQLYGFLHQFDARPGSRVMVAPHNMINLGNDFKEYDSSLEPVYDVASIHFAAEKSFLEYKEEGELLGANPFMEGLMNLSIMSTGGKGEHSPETRWYFGWRQCLDAGLILGAYGSSDNHCSSGLGWVCAGVWATERSRKAILDAIFARRSLAVDNRLRLTDIFDTYPGSPFRNMDQSIVRPDVRFWIDDFFMGSVCGVDSAPTARVRVDTRDPRYGVREIAFVKDGKEVHHLRGAGIEAIRETWPDSNWTGGRHYYYVRIKLSDGTIAYSSPVFVNY